MEFRTKTSKQDQAMTIHSSIHSSKPLTSRRNKVREHKKRNSNCRFKRPPTSQHQKARLDRKEGSAESDKDEDDDYQENEFLLVCSWVWIQKTKGKSNEWRSNATFDCRTIAFRLLSTMEGLDCVIV